MTQSARSTPHLVDPAGEAARLAAVRRYAILDTPPEGAFDRVCAIASRVFGVPIATVTIVDEDRIWFKAATGQAVANTDIGRDPGLCASAILSGDPYVVRDASTDPRTLNNPLVRGELGLRFYAAAPIVTADGHRLGTVNIIDTKPGDIDEHGVQTLQDLAAIVLDELELRLAALTQVQMERQQLERVEQQRRRAEQIALTFGRSLMPSRLPAVPGLDTAAWYEPESADNVGGDFYDLFPIDDEGNWGMFIGDVCGKGLDAATATSQIRYTLRALATVEPDPAAVLAGLHHALLLDPETDDHHYCTAVYAHLSPADRGNWHVVLSAGGHPPPLHLDQHGTATLIAAKGPAVGLFPGVAYTNTSLTLQPGQALLFYTDGITDLRIGDQVLGHTALADHLSGTPAHASEIITAIRQLTATIGPVRDDIALLAISVPQPTAPAKPAAVPAR